MAKKKKGLWKSVLCAVLGLTLLVGATSLLFSNDSNSKGNDKPVAPANTLFDIDYSKCQDTIALQTVDGAFLITGYPTMWITDYLGAEAGTQFKVSVAPYKLAFYNKSADGNITFVSCLAYGTFFNDDGITVPSGANCVILQFTEDSSSYPNAGAVSFENRSTVKCEKL